MSTRTRGVVASAPLLVVGLALVLTACTAGEVEIDSSGVSAADRAACERIVAGLPETLAGEDRRTVAPADALGAAWGDPALVVTCGVPVPAGFDELATCVEVNGVDWFVPAEQVEDDSVDATFTTAGYRPVVELRVPSSYRPEGGAAALAALSGPVGQALENVRPCR